MGKRYLLDTHALLWFQENDLKIPKQILQIIQSNDNFISFSQISLFEISIKQKIGKLPAFKADIEEVYHQAIIDGFTFLNIQNSHIYRYKDLSFFEHHRDPFDRLLIATALEEKAIILSNDRNFQLYHSIVEVLW
jgi:PIN domain nuclease of toxin-antitoxin system